MAAIKKTSGFTLMEVMVAMAIMALVGAALLTIITGITRDWQRLQERGDHLHSLQKLLLTNWWDITQLASSAIPDQTPASALRLDDSSLTFIRGGWSNPFHEPRSRLQLVRYTLGKDVVRRNAASLSQTSGEADELSWTVADGLQMHFSVGGAQDSWPPPADPGKGEIDEKKVLLPKGLAVYINSPVYGDVVQDIPMPESFANE